MKEEEKVRAITWEAPAHHHEEKSGDWFWILGIIAVSVAVAVAFFGDYLFSIFILVAAFVMALVSSKEPPIVEYSVSTRAVRVGDKLYPYTSLESYFIDESSRTEPQLLIKSKRLLDLMIIIPLPEDSIHDIEDILFDRLLEEEMEEPFAHRFLEQFGF